MSKKIDISGITLPDDFDKMSDAYMTLDNLKGTVIYPGAKSLMRNPMFYDFFEKASEIIQKKTKKVFSLKFTHEDKLLLFRAQVFQSVEGKIVVLRRLPSIVPDISKLGFSNNLVELLTHERLNKGGLIIIAGETGQGKSTTAASIISHRLKKFSSFALTIEDPVELPLQGFYQNEKDSSKRGVCFQMDAEDFNMIEAIKDSMRCYPSISNSILFLGETRDSEAAHEVLKVANNGHLVITTMHGNDIKGTLHRFINLAASAPNANANDTRITFGNVFRLLIHQEMEINAVTGKRKAIPQILFSQDSSSRIANAIRENGVDMLSTEIDMQKSALRRNEKIESI